MTKEQQEKGIKELALDMASYGYSSEAWGAANVKDKNKIAHRKLFLAEYLVKKGWRKAGELTVISDGRVADLSKIEKKHKLTFGEVMRDIEKTFGVAGNGLKYSQFILDTLDAEREQAYKAQCDHDREG